MVSGPAKPSTFSRIQPSRRASSIRCRSSTGLVPENSSSFLTPSATMMLPQIFWGAPCVGLPLVRSGRVCILPKFKSGNGAVMDLVRAVREAHRAHRGVIARKTGIVGNAGGTERLNGVVDHLQ